MEFKVFLTVGGRREEVRRFSLEEDEVVLDKLVIRVRTSFPHLTPEMELQIRWEDEEADMVDITTDEELKLALHHMRDREVYRLHVGVGGEEPWWQQAAWNAGRTGQSSRGEEHTGVLCCCCHQQVRGFRYKCVICPNYDMCGQCEDKAMHPAHDMVRIPTPRTYPPHFFMRLHRLYDRCTHTSPTLLKQGCSPSSPSCEQMARDLLADDDSSDISDLELEVTQIAGDGPAAQGTCSSLLVAKKKEDREESTEDDGRKKQLLLMQENLPSFEELTKSMQDLAEKDLDEYCDNKEAAKESKNCIGQAGARENGNCNTTMLANWNRETKTGSQRTKQDNSEAKRTQGAQRTQGTQQDCKVNQGGVKGAPGDPVTQHDAGIQFLRSKCLPKERGLQKDFVETGLVFNNLARYSLGTLDEAAPMDEDTTDGQGSKQETQDEIDTSESFRNIQQEIESLLAPLTPLPDLESVPKAVKTIDDKEMFVLRSNLNKIVGPCDLDNNTESSRNGSFEMVDSNKEYEEDVGSLDEWSMVGDSKISEQVKDEKKDKETPSTEDAGNESSETENEDQVESSGSDDCNGNLVCKAYKEKHGENADSIKDTKCKAGTDDMKKNTSWTVRLDKEIKDLENSAIASSKYISKSIEKVGLNGKLEDSLKNIESSLKITSNKLVPHSGSSLSVTEETVVTEEASEDRTNAAAAKLDDSPTEDKEETIETCSATPKNDADHAKSDIRKSTSTEQESGWWRKTSKQKERHYNPRIADALEKMEGMGFSDDDGWLTQLLVMKHGDISQVLDILTPVKKE